MIKEKPLSEKEMIMKTSPYYGFSKKDVKEAVEKLKNCIYWDDPKLIEQIDKIFGNFGEEDLK